jgi:site-specific DNA recombinase
MIAAVYARKSTEQNGMADEEKSVTRQVEHARAYAARKGWVVADELVFVDDGVSGAEFLKRPGFLRLMNALKPRPPFQVLVMSEESRLGRESIETGYALKQILDVDVRVFFYLEDRERTLDNAMDKVLLSLATFASEMEREKARQRTYDAMIRKARAGHVAGGCVFGYDNVEVLSSTPGADGRHRRQHVVRRVNAEQAAVVRRIFEWSAAEWGFVRIAKALTGEGVTPPRRDTRGWAPSAIREILRRELYRGQIVWNKTRRVDRGGTRIKQDRPEVEWLTVAAPELQIVSDELWTAAHTHMAEVRRAYVRKEHGRMWGRPPGMRDSPYLLTGFASCGVCRGSIYLRKRTSRRRPVPQTYYGCMGHHLRGERACTNGLTIDMARADQAVLEAFDRDVFSPDLLRDAVARALELQQAGGGDDQREALEQRHQRLEREIGRLTGALAQGAALSSVLDALKARERERAEILAKLEHLDGLGRLSRRLEGRELRRAIEERLADWQKLLRRRPLDARPILRRLITGRLLFTPVKTPEGRFYEITGKASYGRLLSGLVGSSTVVPPA